MLLSFDGHRLSFQTPLIDIIKQLLFVLLLSFCCFLFLLLLVFLLNFQEIFVPARFLFIISNIFWRVSAEQRTRNIHSEILWNYFSATPFSCMFLTTLHYALCYLNSVVAFHGIPLPAMLCSVLEEPRSQGGKHEKLISQLVSDFDRKLRKRWVKIDELIVNEYVSKEAIIIFIYWQLII